MGARALRLYACSQLVCTVDRAPACVHGAFAGGQSIALHSAYLRNFRAATYFVGRTALLEADMQRLLRFLGYTADGRAPSLAAATFTHTHCGASCATSNAGAENEVGGGTFNGTWAKVRKPSASFEEVRWYDEAAAAKVVALFRADFDAFGFSTDPARMWETPPAPAVPFQFRV